MGGMEGALRALYHGEIDFGDFARRTRAHWERLAQHLAQRWKQPTWNGHEDIVQDLLFGCWQKVWEFDHTRGIPIDRFVVFNAVDHAKRQMHKARGASLGGTADKNRSRIPRPLSAWDEEGQQRILGLLLDEPEQESVTEDRRAVERALGVCESTRERVVVTALAITRDLESGVHLVYTDKATREALGLKDVRQAAREVVATAISVAERIGQQQQEAMAS